MTTDMDIDSAFNVNENSPPRLTAKQKGKLKIENPEKDSKKEHLPWVEKYRPESLDELVSQVDIIKTIDKFIQDQKLPHLLFYGYQILRFNKSPPGTGKTSTILACAKKLYGQRYKSMILELNASDDRGIDVVREQIISFASTKNIFDSGFKLIILDEADHMTQPAQAALRRVMEKFTRNVRFCIICNYISKIIPAIQSRCTRFRFAPLDPVEVNKRLEFICLKENVKIDDSGKEALLRLTKGDMRRALNILQSASAANEIITEREIYSTTGAPSPADMDNILKWLLQEDFTTAYKYIDQLRRDKGLALSDLISELYVFVRAIEFPKNTMTHIVSGLADIEYRLQFGCSEKIQLGSLVALFHAGKEMAALVNK